MRALLDLLRDEAAVPDVSDQCRRLLREEARHLKILDLEHGEEELIELVAAELAYKLSLLQREPAALVLCVAPTSPLTPTSPLKKWEIICT